MTLDCVIPSQHHRAIMGAKWSNINDLSQRFNVAIKFPNRTPAQSQQGRLNIASVREAVSRALVCRAPLTERRL